MIRKLLSRRLIEYGMSEQLAERLLVYGEAPFIKYLVCEYVDEINVYNSTDALAATFGVAASKIRNAYYGSHTKTTDEVRGTAGYKKVISTLVESYPNREMWDELLRYAFNNVRRFAIELEVLKSGENVKRICDEFCVSESLVYKVRRNASKRFIETASNGIEPYE